MRKIQKIYLYCFECKTSFNLDYKSEVTILLICEQNCGGRADSLAGLKLHYSLFHKTSGEEPRIGKRTITRRIQPTTPASAGLVAHTYAEPSPAKQNTGNNVV